MSEKEVIKRLDGLIHLIYHYKLKQFNHNNLVEENFQLLETSIKYILFDLEATKRELKEINNESI